MTFAAVEISKVLPVDVPGSRAAGAAPAERGPPSPGDIAPPADRADIRPLDIAGALQILLAEARAGFDLPSDDTIAQSPPQAARALVDLFLRAIPEDERDAAAWSGELARVEMVMQTSIERAIGVVAAWRDVPSVVVESVKDAQAQFSAALGSDPRSALWLRPEWIGLAPRFQRFRRRHRASRDRRLNDPDYAAGGSEAHRLGDFDGV